MILHIDGSSVRTKGPRPEFALGWGLVAHFDGKFVETQGAVKVPQHLAGHHELLAAVEAVLFAKSRGCSAEQLALHTDDETVGYAGTLLHEGNYLGDAGTRLRARLGQLIGPLYGSHVQPLVEQYLRQARLHKLPGHRLLVEQERADYLAKQSAWRLLGVTTTPEESFDSWLEKGQQVYPGEDAPPYTWTAPFVGSSNSDDI